MKISVKKKKSLKEPRLMHVIKRWRQLNWSWRLALIAIFLIAILVIGLATTKFLYKKSGTDNGIIRAENHTSQTLQGIYNFRTVGVEGKMKPGILWRSTRLAAATPSDVTYLAKLLHGGTIVDLRTVDERTLNPDRLIPDVSNQVFPISGAASAESYIATFIDDSTDRATFGQAFTTIANADGKVLVHCTQGKDRTGWLVALVMYSLGASDQQVMTEYLRSNNQTNSLSVNADWLNAALGEVQRKYG
ncbi:MAG: tyrosine-protein phosphatase, partial [Candidatus Nomurabacteria bacterium]|nr:tyrosine-protein phosphatase [Candidatus Nomurabacteria bacterium]